MTENLPEKPPHKPYNRTYDRNKVKALATIGVKATDIAKAVDVDVSTITRYLAKIGIKAKEIANYKTGKADALVLSQLKMATITDMIASRWVDDPEAILSQDVRTQKEILIAANSVKTYDDNSERLERGQATQIIRYDAQALRERYNELKRMLDETIDVTPEDV